MASEPSGVVVDVGQAPASTLTTPPPPPRERKAKPRCRFFGSKNGNWPASPAVSVRAASDLIRAAWVGGLPAWPVAERGEARDQGFVTVKLNVVIVRCDW